MRVAWGGCFIGVGLFGIERNLDFVGIGWSLF